MASKTSGISYIKRESPIHNLNGAAKLLMVVLISVAVMVTFDTRYIIFIIAMSSLVFFLGKIKFKEVRFIFGFMLVFLLLNNIMIFLFAPEEGVRIYGTRHELFHIAGHYYVTLEQLFYHLNVTIKYLSIIPIALAFFTTTNPSEFAASLSMLGVSYKASFSVSLALRYIPDVKRDFHEISQAQQARGIDMSKKAKIPSRIKNTCAILFPLIFSSMDRIETISNAMELRSFGKNKKRSWYCARKFKPIDYFVVIASILCVVGSFVLNYINGGRFYNPFI